LRVVAASPDSHAAERTHAHPCCSISDKAGAELFDVATTNSLQGFDRIGARLGGQSVQQVDPYVALGDWERSYYGLTPCVLIDPQEFAEQFCVVAI
jgi:hypothetical protein